MKPGGARPGLLPEQLLAVCGIRQAFGLSGPGEDWTGEDPAVDWERMLAFATREGVHPLVHAGLRSGGRPIPEPIKSRLRIGSLGAAMWAEAVLAPGLSRVLQALGDRGIRPIVLKGAALAYTAYHEPHQRTMSDIDLLLDEEEVDVGGEVVEGLGFRGSCRESAPEHHSPTHYRPELRLGVELHRHLLPGPNPFARFEEECAARCRSARIADVEARVLAPTDALLFTCLHLAYTHRYRFYPLRSLTDILAMATAWSQELDWDLLIETSALARTAGAVYWPLRFSHDWLGAPVPDRVLSKLAPSGAMRRLVAAVMEPRYVLDGKVLAGEGNEVLFNAVLNISLYHGCSGLQQARSALSSLFPPPEAVGHLSPRVTGSRPRYLAELLRPNRLAHGALAIVRLLARGEREAEEAGRINHRGRREHRDSGSNWASLRSPRSPR